MPHYPYTVRRPSHSQEPTGPPKFYNASVPACHSLRTPADFHILALTDASYWLRRTLNPSPSATNLFRSCTSSQGTRLPLRPTGFSVYASPTLFASSLPPDSAAGATLDTGGWLALSRPGLPPGKMRQAYLGAITTAFIGGWNLVVNYTLRHNNAPPAGRKKDDSLLFTGLQYAWGPK